MTSQPVSARSTLFAGTKKSFTEWKTAIEGKMSADYVNSAVNGEAAPAPLVEPIQRYAYHQDLVNPTKQQLTLQQRYDRVYDRDFTAYHRSLSIRTKAYGIIKSGLTAPLSSHIANETFNDTPILENAWLTWAYLKKTYAYDADDPTDNRELTHTLNELVFKGTTSIESWILLISGLKKLLKLSDLAIFETMRMRNLLPTHLRPTLQQCTINKKSWADTQNRLVAAHQLHLLETPAIETRRIQEINQPSSTTPATTGICHNCSNVGHFSRDCKSPFCSRCMQMNTGHVSANCPQRTTSEGGGRVRGRGGRGGNRGGNRGGRGNHLGGRRVDAISNHVDEEAEVEEENPLHYCDPPPEFKKQRTQINMIRRLRVDSISSDNKRWKVDSGAAVHCCTSSTDLEECTLFAHPEPRLQTYSRQPLLVTGTGTVGLSIQDVHIVPTGAENILSTPALQAQGFWVIHPPTEISPDRAVIICDRNGIIRFEGDHNMMVDIHNNVSQTFEGDKEGIAVPRLFQPPALSFPSVAHMHTIGKVPGVTNFLQTLSDAVYFWHCSLAHMHQAAMCLLADNPHLLPSFPLTATQIRSYWIPCLACRLGKAKKRTLKVPSVEKHRKHLSRPTTSSPATATRSISNSTVLNKENDPTESAKPFALKVSSDLFGPFEQSINDRSIAVTFLAEPGSFLISQTLNTKEELVETTNRMFISYKAHGHEQTKIFQSDHENIYGSQAMRDVISKHGASLQRAAPYSHEQAGGIERMAQTLGYRLATLFASAPWIPIKLWEYAMAFATIGINITPHNDTGTVKSPYQEFYKKQFNLQNQILLPFGTPVLFLQDSTQRQSKLSAHALFGAYLGPTSDTKGSVDIYAVHTKRVISSRNYQVLNEVPSNWNKDSAYLLLYDNETADNTEEDEESVEDKSRLFSETTTAAHKSTRSSSRAIRLATPLAENERFHNILDIDPQRLSAIYAFLCMTPTSSTVISSVTAQAAKVYGITIHDAMHPTVKQALASPQSKEWAQALTAELDQMDAMRVFQYVDIIPPDAHPIYLHFVLKGCTDADGSFTKYKARLVALAQNQDKATYEDIRSPTASSALVKLFVALAAKRRRPLIAYDIPGAYLHTKTADAHSTTTTPDIYVYVPNAKGTSTRSAKLLKFIYGLKQSGLEWFYNHSQFLISIGYRQSLVHPCLFTWRESKETTWTAIGATERYHFVLVYVDDDITTGSDQEISDNFHRKLVRKYGEHGTVKVKTENFSFIGYLIEQDPTTGSISLSMPNYIDHILKVTNTPTEADYPTETPEPVTTSNITAEDKEPTDPKEYLKILGLVNFLAVSIRSDILSTVSRLSMECRAPTVLARRRLTRLLKYLATTKHMKIVFSPSPMTQLVGYVDASFNAHTDGTSRTGYAFAMSLDDPCFYCRSAKQSIVTMSSTEAEYVAFYDATLEIIWLRYILNDFGCPQLAPTPLYEDNQSAIALSHGFQNFQRTRHFNLRLQFIRTAILDRLAIIPVFRKSTEQPADMLTKPLSTASHKIHTKFILTGSTR